MSEQEAPDEREPEPDLEGEPKGEPMRPSPQAAAEAEAGSAGALARFAVSQPVLVNLVALSMVIMGVFAMNGMTRESLPEIPTGWCSIATVMPGASPEEIEQLISIPVENAVANVDGLNVIWSASREGISLLFVQMEPEIEDTDRKVIEISNEVARVTVPTGAERPQVSSFAVNIPTLAIAVRGDVPERVLRRFGLDLADQVDAVDGVASVSRNGVREREIAVDVDPDRLAAFGVPLSAVADALRVRAQNIPAGTLGTESARLVRGMTQVRSAGEIQDVVVRPDPAGGVVRVRDVADVREGFAPARLTGRINGEPGVLLLVRKEAQADSVKISADVRALFENLDVPDGVTAEVFGDAAHQVERSLSTLYENMAAGLVLVLALLWFFVGGRNATMAALGLPVAIAGALLAMDAMGITINVISLLALILCLGIVVDDAIIIIENIYRHMEEGMSRRRAAIVGASEVFWPVISSTATTCAAFLPMLLMTGTLGKFFAIIPKVVVASLVASLIEAFFVLPSHMADFGRVTRKTEQPKNRAVAQERSGERAAMAPSARSFRQRWEQIGERVDGVYERFLSRALHRRYVVVLVSYALCAGLVALAAQTKDVVLFTDGDVDMFDVRVKLPTDASKAQTDAVLVEIENRLLALTERSGNDVEAVVAARGLTRTNYGVERGDHAGMVTVYLRPADQRSSLHAGRDLLDATSALFDDLVGPASLDVLEFRPGPPRGAPVAVRIFGDDLDRLTELAEEVVGEARAIPGTRGVAHNFELGKRELQVHVDEERAAMHMLTPAFVALWLKNAFGATPVATVRDGDDEVGITVRLAERARRDAAQMESLDLLTPAGSLVALRDVATIEQGRGPAVIRHRDRSRMITVTSQINERATTSAEVNRLLLERLQPLIDGNPDVMFELGGEYEETNKSLTSLANAFVIAALLIFTILATQFRSFLQPFVVMAAIPLSFIGVVIGFFVTGAPIGMIALIGVVGLAGIVVNDSLVLVDFINQRRSQGLPLLEAVVEASKLRLRPIFLTSITTVAGLVPLAIAGARAPLLAPMANAIAWGLSFATVLTLVIVPCLYVVIADVRRVGGRVFGPFTNWITDPGDAEA